MFGTSYDGVVDWLIFPLPSDPYVQVHVHSNFLMSSWECLFGQCPGILGENEKTFTGDIGCCGDSFYVADAEDHRHVQDMVQRLKPEDWDEELRQYVLQRGYEKGAADDNEALWRGWQHWKKKSESKSLDPDDGDGEWVLKGRVREGACIFANRTTGSVGSEGKIGCAFLHMGQREQAEQGVKSADEVIDLDDDGQRDARHDISMPQVCHQLPLRFVYDYDEDDPEKLAVITIRPWDADEWPGDGKSEYDGEWWCVDDPAAYKAETALHTRMRGTIESLIGKDGYERLAELLEERAKTIAPMPVLTKPDITGGRPLIPLAVVGKKIARPAPAFEERWKSDLTIAKDGTAALL